MTSNQQGPQELYSQSNGTSSSAPFVTYFSTRDPNSNDVNFPIQKRWFNTALSREWILISYSNSTGVLQATWILISNAGSSMVELEGNTGGPVPANGANIIFVQGDGTTVNVSGNAGTSTLTISTIAGSIIVESLLGDDNVAVSPNTGLIGLIGNTVENATHSKPVFTKTYSANVETIDVQVSAAVGSSNINHAGLSSFSSNQFNVDINGFVTLAGSGGAATLGLIPDSVSLTGTSPVLPNGSGDITITSGLSEQGGTAPIITDSASPNHLGIYAQISEASASSNRQTIGLSNFKNNQFAVDVNGFVSLDTIQGVQYVSSGLGLTGIDGSTANFVLTSNGSGSAPSFKSLGAIGAVTSVSGTANRITSTGGSTPVIDISAAYVGQTSLTTLGTITTGIWNGTTISVPNGGTGTTALTAYAVICGGTTSTNPIQSIASVGTAGQILTSNGAGQLPTFQANGGGGGSFNSIVVQTFTASGTYTPTAGMVYCKMEVVGGGGGGGVSVTNAGAGGGGGGYSSKVVTAATVGANKAVTIGAGGAGGPGGAGSFGSTGGTTSVGSTILQATGGSGGSNSTNGGVGGVGSLGDVNSNGGPGEWSLSDNALTNYYTGSGGNSFYGAGGLGGSARGSAGTAYGGGGGGGSGVIAGGNGFAGICVITEFI